MEDLIKERIRALEDQLESAREQLEDSENNPHRMLAITQNISILVKKIQDTKNLLHS